MKLFEDIARTYAGYADSDESHYAYLNRSAQPEFAAARDMLEEWFAIYPPDRQTTFASNFTSDKYGQHFGAFFELYCYALLRALGFEVSVETAVNEERRNPIDFVAGPLDNPSFCVESTVIADSELTVKSQQQLDELTLRLNEISSHRQLILEIGAVSKQRLPYKKIVASVQEWLNAMDAAGVPAPAPRSDPGAAPSYVWAENGWSLLFRVLPGEREGDLVPMQHDGVAWEGPMSQLKETLQEKAKQHKGMAAPYIIAVDIVSKEAMFRSEESIMDDLLGKEIFLFDRNADTFIDVKRSPEVPRRSDREKGLWFGRSGPRNQHVSGVLLVNAVMPWSLLNRTPVLFHNPWADHPLPEGIWPGPQMIPDQSVGAFRRQEGKTIAEIFG